MLTGLRRGTTQAEKETLGGLSAERIENPSAAPCSLATDGGPECWGKWKM